MKRTVLFIGLIATISWIGCGGETKEEAPETNSFEVEQNKMYDLELKDKLSVLGALPKEMVAENNPLSAAKVKLGHNLYYDTQLSKDGNISCNSCHNLGKYGVDNLPTSPGDAGENGDRNSPTVLNAALHTTQFWDGRAKDVEEQAGMPILNPIEMAIPNEAFLVNRLKEDEKYQEMFAAAYPESKDPITYENLRKAIAAFERKLSTPSRFDDYLRGDMSALTLQEKKGMMSFVNIGCTTCHTGLALGGNSIQKFGVHKDYWILTGSTKIDEGLAFMTGNDYEKYMFKVPSLRNIDKTGPYFHDGSVKELEKAVQIMAEAQLDYKLSKSELENIMAFLGSLTGEVPAEYQKAPMN